MVIDPDKMEEIALMNFKGGEGELLTRNFADDKCKIMFSRLQPGACSGSHVHGGNCEIVYIINGTATFCYDNTEETVEAGKVHYCPEGHKHYMVNNTKEELYYLAIVPEHHCK